MKTKYRLFILILFITQGLLHAQKKNSAKTTAVICGTSDSADRVEVWVFPESTVHNPRLSTVYTTETADHNFKIKIPNLTSPTYINVVFRYPHRDIKSLVFYLIEPGDSINISQSFAAFYFPGKNSLKFAYQYQLQQAQPRKVIGAWDKFSDLYYAFSLFDFAEDSIRQVRLKILSDAKSIFTSTVYELLRLNCIYDQEAKFYVNADLNLRLRRKDSIGQKDVIRYYRDHYMNKKIDTTNSIVRNNSYRFIEFLLNKSMLDGELSLNQYKPAVYNFRASLSRSEFNQIEVNYRGILKEKLLVHFFTRPMLRMDSINDCLASAVEQVKQPNLRDLLVEVQRKSVGVPAYNFNLPDSNGKKITLSNYIGKVVVVDFWFTGCEWCIAMANVLKRVSAVKDTNVVFITISVDNSKKIWKESLQRGIFTSPDEINLYTDGLGQKHPLVDFYKISGYPLLLVIDRFGKLFSVNPELGFGVEAQSINLLNLTSAALKEKD